MSSVQQPRLPALRPAGVAALLTALVGGPRRDAVEDRSGRRARRPTDGASDLAARSRGLDGGSPPAGDGAAPRSPRPGRAPGRDGGDDDLGRRSRRSRVSGADEQAGTGGRLRPSSTAGLRRREIEADVIGITRGPGGAPDWWPACWEHGRTGPAAAPELFDALVAARPGVRVLHGVALGGSSYLVDHVLIGPGGIVVVGTESSTGRVRSDGVHLRVRGRDRSEIVDVALWQAETLRMGLTGAGYGEVVVHGVLHWEHLEALGSRAVCLRGIRLLSAGAAVALAARPQATPRSGELSPLTIERIGRCLQRTARAA